MSILNYHTSSFVRTSRCFCISNRFTFFHAAIFVLILLITSSGHARQTVDIANIFPEQLLDLQISKSYEGAEANKGYGYTKKYTLPGEEVKPNRYFAIALIELSRQALMNDRLGPGVTKTKWRQTLQQAISMAPPGTSDEEINSVYRAIESGGWSDNENQENTLRVVMEVDRPGKRLIGFFRFYNYMCYIDSIGAEYATYAYFDEAFRLILERLGWQ